ncbi:MAG TPA: polysaccharide deacetylase family protein [Gemmatimonadales bacterium]|nr:polysaccharide deacetylase family protein [Gemmatimonadales bacterium]
MNILHVLSQREVTGAERFAASLIRQQVQAGHRVTVVSDTLHSDVDAAYVRLPVDRRSYPRRLRNVIALRRLIRQRDVHVVHAHSRAASWVAFFATRLSRVPLVSTLHMLQPRHASVRAFSVYGEEVTAVSRTVEANALRVLGLPRARLHLVPNGVDLERYRPGAPPAQARRALGLPPGGTVIALVGRLSGPRGPIAKRVVSAVFPRVREAVPDATLLVVGGMRGGEDFPQLVDNVNLRLGGECVRYLGHQADVRQALAAADLVIGAGRSALNALAMGRPVVAHGETHYVGVVSEATADECRDTNFGDSGARRETDVERMAADVAALARDAGRRRALAEWGRAFVERHYDVRDVWRRIEGVYRQARARRSPRRIPVLMYHRVEDAPPATRHGIWVTTDAFAAQLDSLARRGFTPITFGDYAAWLDGARGLPRRPVVLTFDDGYADNHANALPLLRRHGMRAVVFLIGDRNVTTNLWDAAAGETQVPLLAADQIREMQAHGIEFASHTLSHPRLTDLDAERLAAELEGSRRAIAERTGRPVLAVCYPYGAVSAAVKDAAARAGYAFGVASDSGPLRLGEDLFEIRRAQVFPRTDGFGFWRKTSSWYLAYRGLRRAATLQRSPG